MNDYKKWFITTFFTTIVTLVLVTITTIVVDPFFHYHKPLDIFPYEISNASYQHPGIAKNFDYDSIIIGTSMTRNFRTSYFKEVLGTNTVKLPYEGSTSKNYYVNLNQALSNQDFIDTIYLGLDLNILVKKTDFTNPMNPLPEYLYNDKYLDDVNYTLNKTVLFNHLIPTFIRMKDDIESTTMDQAFYNADKFVFSQNSALEDINGSIRMENSKDYTEEEILELVKNNLKNIVPFIESYPDTKFVVFIPPYTTLYMYLYYDYIDFIAIEYTIATLLSYDSVELYFYGNNESFTSNLYNYKDGYHYDSHINNFMVDSFKTDEYRLTLENYKEELGKYIKIIDNYNFDAYHGKDNPFINENNFLKYTQKMNDDRYLVFVSSSSTDTINASDIFGNDYKLFNLDNSMSGSNYLAILNGGDVIYQVASSDNIEYIDVVNGLNVEMVAEQRSDKTFIETKLDSLKYTTNQSGVNIVVYDTKLERVLDNIAVNIENGSITRR